MKGNQSTLRADVEIFATEQRTKGFKDTTRALPLSTWNTTQTVLDCVAARASSLMVIAHE